MSKGPDAFRTISEVAASLDLPQHVLRFWETRFKQIKPMKRGGGRRYYRPEDVALLRGIKHLLYGEGYTIRGVQRILKDQGNQYVVTAGNGRAASVAKPVKGTPPAAPARVEPRPVPPPEPPVVARPPGGAAADGGDAAPLLSDEVDLLKTVLSELDDLKRLLDRAQ